MYASFTTEIIKMVNQDLEKKIVICLMQSVEIDNDLKLALMKLKEQYFYKPIHKDIFKLLLSRYNENKSLHFIDVIANAPDDNDIYMILHDYFSDSVNGFYKLYDTDIDLLIASYHLRERVNQNEKLLKEIKNHFEPQEALKRYTSQLANIANFTDYQSNGVSLAEAAEKHYNDKDNKIERVETGIYHFDAMLGGGFMAGTLATFAAGAGVGKTYLAVFLYDAILKRNPEQQGLFFSLEMRHQDIIERQKATRLNKIYKSFNDEEHIKATQELMLTKGRIYDTSIAPDCSDLDYICNTARIEHAKTPLKVVVIDYMTAIETSKRFDRDDLKYKYIASKLAKLAIDLGCLIITLVHINRNPAQRAIDDRVPRPSDETQSQGAHVSSSYWFGLDRPFLHTHSDRDKNTFIIACRKNRYGNEFIAQTMFNAGLFSSNFGYYTQQEKTNPSDY